jgi:aminoglycoside 6'-N-acetyltransferase
MQRDDLEQFQAWVHSDHVYEWWYEDARTIEELEELYGPYIDVEGPGQCFFAQRDGRDVGYVQWYRIGDEPEWMPPSLVIPPTDVAIDLFIGEVGNIGSGWGPEMIRAFLSDLVFPAAPDAEACWIDPDPPNARAVRAYAKVGFETVALAERKGERGLERALIMRAPRSRFE